MLTTNQNVFAVELLSYDQDQDLLIAVVRLARTCLEPEVELDPADSLECFTINANFSQREYTIRDTTDHAGDVELHYPASVLTAFLKQFDLNYHALGHEASPGDVDLFRFNVAI